MGILYKGKKLHNYCIFNRNDEDFFASCRLYRLRCCKYEAFSLRFSLYIFFISSKIAGHYVDEQDILQRCKYLQCKGKYSKEGVEMKIIKFYSVLQTLMIWVKKRVFVVVLKLPVVRVSKFITNIWFYIYLNVIILQKPCDALVWLKIAKPSALVNII